MVYIISDGVNDISEGVEEITSDLISGGVRILALGVGADSSGKHFLRGLTSKPHSRYFKVYSLNSGSDQLSHWLINSLCVQGGFSETHSL